MRRRNLPPTTPSPTLPSSAPTSTAEHRGRKHDPEKVEPVFGKRSCSNKKHVAPLLSWDKPFMPTEILMPALSPTMERGNLAKWLKKEGDAVKSGDVIAEIETDKATMEVEAVDEGTLGKILVPEGTNDVAVNTPIAMILADGEDASALRDGGRPASVQKAAEPAPPATQGRKEQ